MLGRKSVVSVPITPRYWRAPERTPFQDPHASLGRRLRKESDENNALVVTARNQPFQDGLCSMAGAEAADYLVPGEK